MDEPDLAEERILSDVFLRHIYEKQLDFIRTIYQSLNDKTGVVLEIGAAGGITKMVWPEVITTDVRLARGVDKVMSAHALEFPDSSIDLLFGMDALHHIPQPSLHFKELERCLKPGGKAVYIEPNWNLFSKVCFGFALKYLHPEPYDFSQKSWELQFDDPMMGNQAQAHNIFVRDSVKFRTKYPLLQVQTKMPLKGLAFLASGGVHTRLPLPRQLLVMISRIEHSSEKWINVFGLGRLIEISKR